jgi:hypothetical protein
VSNFYQSDAEQLRLQETLDLNRGFIANSFFHAYTAFTYLIY